MKRDLGKARDQHLKDAKDIREGHFTDFQKKALIGGGIAAAVLITYGAWKLHDTRARRYIQTGDKIIGIPFKRNELLSRTMTSDQIMKEVVPQVNPGKVKTYGRSNNCLRCSFAYELRRRGYDVEATSTARGGFEQTKIGVARALSGASKIRVTQSDLGQHSINTNIGHSVWLHNSKDLNEAGGIISSRIFNTLSKQEIGSRGELGMSWRFGGAHSIVYENISGKVHIFDPQRGKHFATPEEFLEYAKNIKDVAYTRLDNIDVDENFLFKEWIQNVK